MKRIAAALAALAALTGISGQAAAQVREQFVPANFYWVGPFAPGGTGIAGGMIDYMKLINERDGGINGVRLTWEKCETEYNNARGVECYERTKKRGPTGASMVHPLSTGIAYALLERATADRIPIVTIGYGRTDAADGRVFPYKFPLITTYWSQADVMLRFMAKRSGGGMEQLRGKRIVHLYHDSAYGREPIPVLQARAKEFGFDLSLIAVPSPGNEQQAQWLQIRQIKPDFVILWGWGVMNPTALRAAQRAGFPRDRMIGVWWSGAEEDVIPAGEAARGFIAAGFNPAGAHFPVIREIQKYVYGRKRGEMDDPSRLGSIYYNRGVVHGIITVEAIRRAQERFGKGQSMTGEQVRWGLENLVLDAPALKRLGAEGFMPTLRVTCEDHEGSGLVRFQQWDGKTWKSISDWMEPDRPFIRAKIEASAAQYAKERNITPRDCSKEK